MMASGPAASSGASAASADGGAATTPTLPPSVAPHRRYNPLAKRWVLCSPHRLSRPWNGEVSTQDQAVRPVHDPKCNLCPRSARATGEVNPDYSETFVFTNDFSAVVPVLPADATPCSDGDDLFVSRPERGQCRVICFSPRHDLTLAEMDVPSIRAVVDVWTRQYQELSTLDYVSHVQIFENKGAMMGCSNPHPHGQIWATESIPVEAQVELDSLQAYQREKGGCMLCRYAAHEVARGVRVVARNEHFVAVVPYWAAWPFEVLVMSTAHVPSLLQLDDAQRTALAEVLQAVTVRYDNLFACSFPYSMGLHQAPVRGDPSVAHLHVHFYPPLLRSATVRKFMVGYEMLGEPQRDLTPEAAAAALQRQSAVHYLQQRASS